MLSKNVNIDLINYFFDYSLLTFLYLSLTLKGKIYKYKRACIKEEQDHES